MMKIRNVIIYLCVCIVVFISFEFPEILLNLENKEIGLMVYEMEKKSNKLDVEIEKIYLVKAIHEMEGGKIIQISSTPDKMMLLWEELGINSNNSEEALGEILKLNEYKIIKTILMESVETENNKIGLITKQYESKDNNYIVRHLVIQVGTKEFILNIENKTGKILYMAFEKNDLYSDNIKEILENYVKYLNLYVIDDWKYEEDEENKKYFLNSEKAGLQIKLEEDDKVMISIHVKD